MSMDVQMSSESGCLYGKATGEFSLAEAERTFLEVVKEVERHRVCKVLLMGEESTEIPE